MFKGLLFCFIVSTGFILINSGCSKTNAEDLVVVEEEDSISNNTSNLCEPEGLYSSEVKPIIDANCVSCHAPGGSVSFLSLDTHSNTVNNSTNLMAAINHDSGVSAMPPGSSKLSDCDIQTIQKWIDANMPDN